MSAAVLAAVRDRVSPAVRERLHDAARPKPFAVTPLLDDGGRALADPRRAGVRIEVGVLRDDLASPVVAALTGGVVLRLGHSQWFAPGPTVPFCASYRLLLDHARPVASWTLELVTPVSFATGRGEGARRQRILPEPECVFGTLASRWRALAADVTLPAAVDEVIHDHLELVDCRLRVAEHLTKTGTPPRRGSVGRVRYAVADAARVPESVLAALAALVTFAQVGGIGDRTAVGMGHVQVVSVDGSAPTAPRRRPGQRPTVLV